MGLGDIMYSDARFDEAYGLSDGIPHVIDLNDCG